jgi:hypothetical protein
MADETVAGNVNIIIPVAAARRATEVALGCFADRCSAIGLDFAQIPGLVPGRILAQSLVPVPGRASRPPVVLGGRRLGFRWACQGSPVR